MLANERLVYPSDGHVPGYVVEPIPEATDEIARRILVMQAGAYVHHFSNPESYAWPLDEDKVRGYFHPGSGPEQDREKITTRKATMQRHIDGGTQYLGLTRVGGRPELTDERIAGLVKVSPSRSRIAALFGGDPNLFVNDIIVAEELQAGPDKRGKSAGATLMHAALGYTGYSPDRAVALHAFDGDSVANWYGRIGLKRMATRIAPVEIAGETMPQVLYTSEGSLTIGGVMRVLEKKHPQLAFGELMTTEQLAEYDSGD